jgi:succinoglycan biosynthesis transport protein ExoP
MQVEMMNLPQPPEKISGPSWNFVRLSLDSSQSPQVDIWPFVLATLRRWKLIVVITLMSLILAYGALKAMPLLYKSTVEILVFDPEGRMDKSIEKRISPFVDMVDETAMNTELDVITSKSLALRVVKKLRLYKDPEFQPQDRLASWLRWWSGKNRPTPEDQDPEKSRAKRIDAAVEALRGHIQAERVGFSYVLAISATSRDPVTAQHLAAALADEYLADQREARQHSLQRVATWLKSRLEDLQSRIMETETSIKKLESEPGVTGAGMSEQQISDLNKQLMTARGEVEEKRAQLDQVRQVSEGHGNIQDIPAIMASPVITQLRQQQSELSWREQQLRKRLGDNHMAVKLAGAELGDIDIRIRKEVNHILEDMKNAYDIAVRREQLLEANLKILTASRNNPAAMKLRQLQRADDADHKLYESYLSQFNSISTRQLLQDASARIISPADLPPAPSDPRRKRFFAVAGVLGLGGASMLVFLLEYLWAGVKTSTDVERSFGCPVVGVIPFLGAGKDRRRSPYDRLVHTVVDAPLSQFSEAVRAVRIQLQRSNLDRTPQVVLITSSLPGEGKSAIARLLAASSAMSGHKTVLVDCDLHHRQISTIVGQEQPGLVEVLTGKAKIEEVTIKDLETGTAIIPAGSISGNPADLLISRRMHEVIGRLRDNYDFIVIDTSPLLAVVDALALAAMVDKILVIVEWSRTPRTSISEAFKALKPEAHRIAGVVFNRADLKQMQGYGYISGYGYRSPGQ